MFDVGRPATAICAGNNQAISIDIDDSNGGLKLTFCALLQFELDGKFNADGLLNEFEESLDLSVAGDFNLFGALAFGCEINVVSNGLAAPPDVTINFDPITAQLYVDGGLEAVVSFGMLEAFGNIQANLTGDFGIAYCPSCDGTYDDPDPNSDSNYTQLSNTSSFYLKNVAGYSVSGGVGIRADIPGLEITTGLEFGIEDTNVFDQTPAVVTLPDAQALRDSIKFTPELAVGMLRLVDAVS